MTPAECRWSKRGGGIGESRRRRPSTVRRRRRLSTMKVEKERGKFGIARVKGI